MLRPQGNEFVLEECINQDKYMQLRRRMSRYEKFLGLDFEEYMQQPQIFEVSLFDNKTNITSDQTGGMSITPQNPNVVSSHEGQTGEISQPYPLEYTLEQ